jgi:hypothetical protein
VRNKFSCNSIARKKNESTISENVNGMEEVQKDVDVFANICGIRIIFHTNM